MRSIFRSGVALVATTLLTVPTILWAADKGARGGGGRGGGGSGGQRSGGGGGASVSGGGRSSGGGGASMSGGGRSSGGGGASMSGSGGRSSGGGGASMSGGGGRSSGGGGASMSGGGGRSSGGGGASMSGGGGPSNSDSRGGGRNDAARSGGSSGGTISATDGVRAGRSGDGGGQNRNVGSANVLSGNGSRDADRGNRSDSVRTSNDLSVSSSSGGIKDRGESGSRSRGTGSIETAGFLEKHGNKSGRPKGDTPGKNQTSSAVAAAGNSASRKIATDAAGRTANTKARAAAGVNVNDLHDHGNFLHDHASDTFLHKHGGRTLHDHVNRDFLRVRNDGTLRDLGSSRGWNHWGHRHGNRSSFFFGFGGPFYSFGYGPYWGAGFYNPLWYGGYGYGGRPYGYGFGWPYFGGYWPSYGFGWPYYGFGRPNYGGLSIGYASRHFGVLYNSGYGYGWPGFGYGPSYGYDPYCVYPSRASYIVTSPSYAAVPNSETTIDAAPTVSDASTARIKPIPMSPPNSATRDAEPDPVAGESGDFARDGELAFKQSNYKSAIRSWRHALLDEPENGTLLMMLAQAHFQLGEYDQAAGATQQGMLAMPKDKWGVVVKNYEELYGKAKIKEYTEQLKALEKAVEEKPKDPARRFLLGFHFFYLDFPKEALRELTVLREVAKNDKLGEDLFKMAEEGVKKKESKSEAPQSELPKKPDGQ